MLDTDRKEMLRRIGYSTRAIDILESNMNIGEIPSPDIYITDESSCGDILFLYISISNNVIQDARFQYIGCAGMQVAGSTLTQLVKSLSIEQAMKISEDDVIDVLERVPPEKIECIEFAVATLRKALARYHTEAGRALPA